MYKDDHVHRGMRRKLLDLLREKGIRSGSVLSAMDKVPRHAFIDDTAFLRMAYDDIPFPIGHEQTISQPYTVARQTELLAATPGDKVLEIGTGCGYQTAVLCALGLKVTSVERVRALHIRSKARLMDLGFKAHLTYGDGFKGQPTFAPYDRVLVTCGAPAVPEALLSQLKSGGRMVIPVGEGEVQKMLVLDKGPDGTVNRTEHGVFRFVPMLEHKRD